MPKYGFLVGQDQAVAQWTFSTWHLFPRAYNLALGILDQDKDLIGSCIFREWNGYDIELWYYGPETPTVGIAKALAGIAAYGYGVGRGTLKIERENVRLISKMQKFGFKIEGIEQKMYGPNRDVVRMVIFREQLLKLAGDKRRWAAVLAPQQALH